jgi:hypothetical protein
MRTIDPNSSNRESPEQDDADLGCRLISLLSFLEAEHVRLRQAILELSVDARTLREALKRVEARPSRDRSIGPPTCQGRSRFERVRKRGPGYPFEPLVLIDPLIDVQSSLCGKRG